MHHGSYIARTIAGNVELLGPDVTMAHQMLKNDVVLTTGWQAYALISAPAVAYLGVSDVGGQRLELEYEHAVPMSAAVLPLGLDHPERAAQVELHLH